MKCICPVCKASPDAPCTFKVKDGYQQLKGFHNERIRLDLVMELNSPQEEEETVLDFQMRVHRTIQKLIDGYPNEKSTSRS